MHRINTMDAGDPRISPYLDRIRGSVRQLDPEFTAGRAARSRSLKPLRLEPWEVAAFRSSEDDEGGEVALIYRFAAALRLKIEEEATELSRQESEHIDEDLGQRIQWTLARGKELDDLFGDAINEGEYRPDSEDLDRLHRSRLRLLRSYSGLWLLFDERLRRHGHRAAPIVQ